MPFLQHGPLHIHWTVYFFQGMSLRKSTTRIADIGLHVSNYTITCPKRKRVLVDGTNDEYRSKRQKLDS